jgi:hypothetical protein
MRRLLVMANVPNSPILVTLMMEALNSAKTSVFIKAIWCKVLYQIAHPVMLTFAVYTCCVSEIVFEIQWSAAWSDASCEGHLM